MAGPDRARLISALVYLFIAAFLLTGIVSLRYRRALRGAAVFLYLAAVVAVLAWIALWLAGWTG